MESELPVKLGYREASPIGQEHAIVEIEEPVEATAQSSPAESPVDSQLPRVTIPKVPEGHRNGGRDAYEPSIISIGPYHHGKPRLLPMESLKRKCFDRIKDRSKKILTLDECFMELDLTGMEARRCYSENTDHIIAKDFLEMMMLDACFIIEYCLCFWMRTLPELLDGRIWVDTAIRHDLLLLENQIPFFFVKKVFSIFEEDHSALLDFLERLCGHASPINVTRSLPDYPFLFGRNRARHVRGQEGIRGICPRTCRVLFRPNRVPLFGRNRGSDGSGSSPDLLADRKLEERTRVEGKHLLHFYHSCLFYRTGNPSPNTAFLYADKPICTIRSATFLEEAGIEFEQEVDGVMSVTFQNGIMKITPLFIDAFTVSQFRNLIALEKHDSSLEPQATAFAQFMDYIINTSKDVDLLRKKGILDHSLGSDEEIATIFNQLTSGIHEYRTKKLARIYKKVDKYCKTKRHLWWEILMKDYFGNPWTAISLVAAVILLSLTFIQTFFSMYSYFRPPSAK